MIETIHRLLDRIYLACIWISGIAIILMSLIIPWGIYARYVLGTGSNWPEPVAVLLMVTFTFFGAAATYRASGHIAVGMLTDYLPKPLQWLCVKVVHALMIAICLFVMVWGTKLSMETMRQALAELPWLPVGYTYLPLPIGSGLILLFVLEHALLGPQNHRAVVTFDHDDVAPNAQAN
ncbi:TRAP transporter small permease [Hydrogenophaga sp. PAMC20947]|uniref:TRAP transporter small permease n=1 Tax=Hydrogenophaga sp. PAMC20947 TaxID=2565558 RepID=UPI00109E1C13|nr:TRAP transporter small permease [Hydrogenophaga sp. PAMC20947]QCB47136.1 TRAP transporter small permease [Hydrogenophaga sp. PAMC20947]